MLTSISCKKDWKGWGEENVNVNDNEVKVTVPVGCQRETIAITKDE